MNRIFEVIFWTLVLSFVATTMALVGGPSTSAVVAVISPMPSLLVALLTTQSRVALRRRRAAVVLTYLEQAVRLNLPLPRFLGSAAASESGMTFRRLIALRNRLEAGDTIDDSLGRSVPEISSRALGLIAAAQRTGRLPQALDRLVREDRRTPRDPSEQAFFITYPIAMSAGLIAIVSMIMIFVMPKYQMILKDFGAPMPPATMWLLSTAKVFADNAVWMLLLLLLGLIVWFVADLIWPAMERRWSWLTGWFTRDRDLADVCRVVADALDSGLPLDAALRHAGELSISNPLRWRLYRWAGGIERGDAANDAAKRARMPKIIVGLVSTAQVTAARETFVFLARYYASLFRRMQAIGRAAAVPGMVFFFASVVALVALGLFMPIITLIDVVGVFKRPL
jgi:type II secretory pathway component PulF